MTITAGDAVTWKNVDTKTHQIVANRGQFASPILSPGGTYNHTFNQSGTFGYHDALHPALKGTVVVKGAPAVVTLAASAPLVKFGTQVTLTGTVSSKKAGETVQRMACDAVVEWVVEAAGMPIGIGRRSRIVPAWLRRHVAHRDGGCRFPGCGRTR